MDEDFALWNFLEEERERFSKEAEDLTEAQQEFLEDEDESEDEELEKLVEKIGQGIIRRGGNY